MILGKRCLLSAFIIELLILIIQTTSCQLSPTEKETKLPCNLGNQDNGQQQDDTTSNLNITQLLLARFHYLFPAADLALAPASTSSNNKRELPVISNYSDDSSPALRKALNESLSYDSGRLLSPLPSLFGLENRKIEQQQAGEQFQRRGYFRIMNRVFSRMELPEVYARSRYRGGHCGLHIGCIEEIPNFPSLLKKPNVSSSFTIYTGGVRGNSVRIPFEPIVHHQLQDANSTESQEASRFIPNRLNNNHHHQHQNRRKLATAVSWRSASNIVHTQEYPFDLALVEQSNFDPSQTTRIIVGGYFAKEDEEWIDEVVRQWLLLEPTGNVIKVSWADANRGLYHTAAYNSRIVGRQLTLFLYYLDQMFHIDLNKFHLVGHSLGAHIAGFVGADNEGRIARITGLDPAGPIFVELNASMRLDPSDAKFVDVVHTNGGTITKGALGLSTPSGHVDYYCNGGSLQPGCYFSSVTKSIMDPVERVACSHRRSYRYFIEIIKMTISNELQLATKHQQNQQPSQPAENHDYNALLAASTATNFSSNQGHEDLLLLNNNQIDRRSGDAAAGIANFVRKSITAHLPKAFLFEAKQDELVRLTQPEIVLLSQTNARRELSADLAPLKHPLEFHLLNPEFPLGKRGMYFFKTRSEPPFFASKQYALTLKTDTVVRRKMALLAKIDQTVIAEVELDEIPGVYTIAFTPNDARLVETNGRVPNLYLMWKHRSFNLLQLNQQNELHLSSVELSLLDTEDEVDSPQTDQHHHQLIRYAPASSVNNRSAGVGVSVAASAGRGDLTLYRNQWHKLEGKLANGN